MEHSAIRQHKKTTVIVMLVCAVALAALGCLLVGSSHMTAAECFDALLR